MKTTHTIWGAVDGDGPVSGVASWLGPNCLLFEVSQDTDDGTYPTVASYTRDANALDDEGASHWINRLTRKKDKTRIEFYDGVTIVRDSRWSDDAVLEFKEPIDILVGQIGDRQIVEKVKKIRGKFGHDWFWTKNGRQSKLANGYEIWFSIEEYLE